MSEERSLAIHSIRSPSGYTCHVHTHQQRQFDCQRCGQPIRIGEKYHAVNTRRKMCVKCFTALAYEWRRE